MIAELALKNSRKSRIPFKFGDVKRAGYLAVTAAYTGILIIANHAGVRAFCQSRHRTGRHTGGVNAMHAVTFYKGIPINFLIFGEPGAVLVFFYHIKRLSG